MEPCVSLPTAADTVFGTHHVERVVWRQELQKKLGVNGVCSRTITRYIATGRLPPPDIQITLQRTGWRLSTLVAAGLDWL